MAAAQEDFSFPPTTDTLPRSAESPRLWRTASASTPEVEIEEDSNFLYYSPSTQDKHFNSSHRRRSLSHVESGGRRSPEEGRKYESDPEEKMDMLWEDFNSEEFSSRNPKRPPSSSPTSSRWAADFDQSYEHNDSDNDNHRLSSVSSSPVHGRMINFGCMHSFKFARPHKRLSLVVFMKVLKKMTVAHQNSRARGIKKTQS